MLALRIAFGLGVALFATLATIALARRYLRTTRLDRPAIGVFNGRDITILFVFLAVLQNVYLLMPHWLLTTFLAITFASSLSIGYRPVVRPVPLWLGIGLLIGLNIWLARNMLGTVMGWQLFWLEGDILVLLGAAAVANLYVQGGMRLQYVARFTVLLGIYDITFVAIAPLTNALAEDFLGYPLNPSFGFRLGLYNAIIGLGDLLIYSLFVIAALKAYGRKAARTAVITVILFGVIGPAVAPALINFIDARADIVVPAQTFFGPAAFVCYLWLKRRYGRERTMQEFLASTDVKRPVVTAAATPAPASVPEPVSTQDSPQAAVP
jgi:hypothetical protein